MVIRVEVGSWVSKIRWLGTSHSSNMVVKSLLLRNKQDKGTNVTVSPTSSAITGPVAKECADLWPRIASNAGSIQ